MDIQPVKEKKPRKVNVQPHERKLNKWSEHVKQYCTDNDIKYRDALRSEDCKKKYIKIVCSTLLKVEK
jgi:hypothetical protein